MNALGVRLFRLSTWVKIYIRLVVRFVKTTSKTLIKFVHIKYISKLQAAKREEP